MISVSIVGVLAFAAFLSQTPPTQEPSSAQSECSGPIADAETLYSELNEYTTRNLDDVWDTDPKDAGAAKIAGLRKTVETAVTRFEAAIECLALRGTLAVERAAVMRERARLLLQLASEAHVTADPNTLLDYELKENDPSDVYPLRLNNRLRYLDRGDEHRDEVLETIRSAKKYVHMSYFEMYPDRMGYTVATLLIATKLGKQSPCEIAKIAQALGLPEPLNHGDCGNDQRLVTGPLPTADFSRPSARDLRARAEKLLQERPTLDPIEIQLYLDNSKKSEFQLAKDGIAGALALFGVRTNLEMGAVFLSTHDNNHTKITVNERRAVLSGGNIVDKVMDWTKERRWRDAAILVEGDLVNDINHFFVAKFRGIRHQDLNEVLCRGDQACPDSYFPAVNRNRTDLTDPGRLIWSSNFDLKTTPTWKAVRDVVRTAQHSLYFENAFYSDGFVTFPLIAKARSWRLRELKAANGERPDAATCGPDYFKKVAGRPGGKFMIVVLPKDMDQPFVKAAEGVLTNHLVYWGVDVCKWSGRLNNKVHIQPDGRAFQAKTMLHSEVFMADERIAYVGSANLNRRSMLGDLEIGVLTEDPETVKDIHERMFVNDIVVSGDMRLGWDSPVREVVHPKYVNLEARGGLGWLEGFNEWMARCGLEWAGHPGQDRFINNVGEQAEMNLTLHGKVANIPASEVDVIVEREPRHRIRVRGRVDERAFYGPKLELWTEVWTEPGSSTFQIEDALTNRGAFEQEFQVLYHANYGPRLLGAGSRVSAAVRRVTPFNTHAARDVATYADYAGPQRRFIEQVYNLHPYANPEGRRMVMLRNAAGDRGVSMGFAVAELPYVTLWKNLTALEEGYVTGLEPGMGFPTRAASNAKPGACRN